jgi:hypothetical protein
MTAFPQTFFAALVALTHQGLFGFTNEEWILLISGAQLLVFILQLAVFGYQALKLRQTVDAAAKQSDDIQRSIAEATRAANAMEKSANAATIGSQAASESVLRISHQMGAYLSVRVAVRPSWARRKKIYGTNNARKMHQSSARKHTL